MTFYQFIERLQSAGWTPAYDAQWENAKKMYDELLLQSIAPRLPAEPAETLKNLLPKLVLWGLTSEEVIHSMRESFVNGYHEGFADGLLSNHGVEQVRVMKYVDDLRLLAAAVAACDGQVRN